MADYSLVPTNGDAGYTTFGDTEWGVPPLSGTEQDQNMSEMEGTNEAQLAAIRDAVNNILFSGGTPQQQADAAAALLQQMGEVGLGVGAIEQATGISVGEITGALADAGYDGQGNPITPTTADPVNTDPVITGPTITDSPTSTGSMTSVSTDPGGLIVSQPPSTTTASEIFTDPNGLLGGNTDPVITGGTTTPTGTDETLTPAEVTTRATIRQVADNPDLTNEQKIDIIAQVAHDNGISNEDAAAASGINVGLIASAVGSIIAAGAGGGDGGGSGGTGTPGTGSNPDGNNIPGGGNTNIPLPGGTTLPGGQTAYTPAQREQLFGPQPTGESTISTRATIPPFLENFLVNSANASNTGIQSLTDLLQQPNALVDPFNALQTESMQMQEDFARDPNGLLAQAQNAFSSAADDTELKEWFTRGSNLLENPSGLSDMQGFTTSSALNQTAQDQLEGTARGDYQYGNPAFDEAVQASIRAARPGILSNFSTAGPGAVKGGLAQIGMQQAASDAFAGLYNQERGRQMGASGALNTAGLNDRTLQQNAANATIGANQNAGSAFTNAALDERGRQLNAAAALPQLGLLQSGILGGVGDAQQAQGERENLGDVQAMQQLLGSSFGNINPTVLFGNSQQVPTQDSNPLLQGLGGAAVGSQLFSDMFPGFTLGGLNSTQIGGIAGGLLGGFS